MIRSLSVKNFRNLDITNVRPSSSTTIIVGENGQGKTNLLEAVFYLAYGKSFIADKSKVINWRHDEALITGETDVGTIRIVIRKAKETRISINRKQKPVADLFGKFLCVSFHPKDIDLVTGAPALRRSWLDRLISTLERKYFNSLVKYNKAIQNRNKVLQASGSSDQLDVWDDVVAKLGTQIWVKRRLVIDQINTILKNESVRITGKTAFLNYEVPVGINQKDVEEKYKLILKARREKDTRLNVTTFGPHRDDFKIIFEEKRGESILQKEVIFYGSRAEQRQAVLMFKLAETRLLNEEFGEYPTLLLDDIASELDDINRQFLTKPFAKQLILTTTSLKLLPKELVKKAKVLRMKEGKLQSLGASSV